MLEIKQFTFGPFATNTYVVLVEQGQALLVDPACSCDYEEQVLLRYMQSEKLQVKAIIATHGH